MEIREQEKSRARNLIWNAARDYSFEPDFKAYDEEGQAESPGFYKTFSSCTLPTQRRGPPSQDLPWEEPQTSWAHACL